MHGGPAGVEILSDISQRHAVCGHSVKIKDAHCGITRSKVSHQNGSGYQDSLPAGEGNRVFHYRLQGQSIDNSVSDELILTFRRI